MRTTWLDLKRRLGILAACSALAACNYSGPPVTGKVLEVTNADMSAEPWKLAPVADAEILVLWSGYRPSIGHASSVCLKKLYTRSDPQGNFRVDGWKMKRTVGSLIDIQPTTYVYAPGFVEIDLINAPNQNFPRGGDKPVEHYLRRTDTPPSAKARANAFFNAELCPSPGLPP